MNEQEGYMYVLGGKGRGDGKDRTVPLTREYIALWNRHVELHDLRGGDPVFFSRRRKLIGGLDPSTEWEYDHGTAMAASSIRSLIDRLEDEAHVAIKAGDVARSLMPPFSLEPKVLRKTFACTQLILDRLGMGGMGIKELQSALGHSSLNTTQIYLSDVERYLGANTKSVGTREGTALIVEALAEAA